MYLLYTMHKLNHTVTVSKQHTHILSFNYTHVKSSTLWPKLHDIVECTSAWCGPRPTAPRLAILNTPLVRRQAECQRIQTWHGCMIVETWLHMHHHPSCHVSSSHHPCLYHCPHLLYHLFFFHHVSFLPCTHVDVSTSSMSPLSPMSPCLQFPSCPWLCHTDYGLVW